MPYRSTTFEVTKDTQALDLAAEEEGIALTIKRRGMPVGFVFRRIAGRGRVRSIDVQSLVDQDTAAQIAASAARDKLPQSPERALSVSIAMCTRDRPELAVRCLRSLFEMRQAEIATDCFEIILVDNASPDERTRDLVQRDFPTVRYLREPRQGLNFARNAALRAARGALVAFVDDDVIVDPEWLAALARACTDEPDAALITGQVLPLELETKAQVLFELRGGFRRGFARVHHGPQALSDRYFPCNVEQFGTGANMAVNRNVVLALGGFDEALDTGAALPGGGDLDIFYRIVRAGHNVLYDPAFLVFHQHRRDLAGLRRQYRNSWGKAYLAYAMKHRRNDPQMRSRWNQVIVRWFGKQALNFLQRLMGRHSRPLVMIVHETWGGIVGLCGAYDRSRRLTDRIRQAHS